MVAFKVRAKYTPKILHIISKTFVRRKTLKAHKWGMKILLIGSLGESNTDIIIYRFF